MADPYPLESSRSEVSANEGDYEETSTYVGKTSCCDSQQHNQIQLRPSA